jgi:hypothetical protein
MHQRIEGVQALHTENAITGRQGPSPTRPARLQNLLAALDVLPDIDQFFGPLRQVLE